MTDAQDLRELNEEDLRTRERDLQDQLFRLRIQNAVGQLDAPTRVRDIRRDLARVKTVLREKARASGARS
jgi:large subunit ribosomal protein L29